jgi:hypothetical protein
MLLDTTKMASNDVKIMVGYTNMKNGRVPGRDKISEDKETMKLRGIYIIRGWEDSSDDDVIKTFALIENTENGKIFSDLTCMIDIPRSMKDRDLEDVKKAELASSLGVLERMYKINWKNKDGKFDFEVKFEDVSDMDLRASYPNTEFLKYVFHTREVLEN